jgi:hypothetical protein
MTTINNIEDLIRVLDENPEWVEAVRARLMTRELLELPRVVAEIAERIARIEENQAELSRSQAELARSHVQLAEALARLESRQDRMQDDLGWLKGRIIYDIVRDDAGIIAHEMGFVLEQTLVRADLMELTRGQDVSDLSRGTLQSFHRADLMMRVADAEGGQRYVAVEASFTVNGRDSRRALRNAELMTRFTGQPAMAAVAGVRYDWDLKNQIEFEQLHWYEIPSEDLEAE